MSHKIQMLLMEEIFELLGATVAEEAGTIQVTLPADLGLRWKGKKLKLTRFKEKFSTTAISFGESTIKINSAQLSEKEYSRIFNSFEQMVDSIWKENIAHPKLWERTIEIVPTGFVEKENTESLNELERLYSDDFIVREKKGFVIDLKKSMGPYLVSKSEHPKSIIDGAAQIASLALGFNDQEKSSMAIRPEVNDPFLDVENWDVTNAYVRILKQESGLKQFYPANSGAEGNEIALRACFEKFPGRRKVFAFEGSFHGRSLLTLHCTHNPSKRLPFQIYDNMVEFFSFPEDKTPHVQKVEPKGWLDLWDELDSEKFEAKLTNLEKVDDLIGEEINTLKSLRNGMFREKPLAVLLEPMLCEGGDRYGSNRFFRALRVLTRAKDIALVFDEVQTGFGLGGSFFWHKSFNLVTADGEKEDHPDAVVIAKKAQIGGCLTNFKLKSPKIEFETSAASVYRGYLQAASVLDEDSAEVESTVRQLLTALQLTLGEGILKYPRNKGYAFAFDLASGEILTKLVGARFSNGTIFYPAGSLTARFRLMVNPTEQHLSQLFLAVYRCFETISKEGVIGPIPTESEFIKNAPGFVSKFANEKPLIKERSAFADVGITEKLDDVKNWDQAKWRKIFSTILREAPGVVCSNASKSRSLNEWNALSFDGLKDFYLKNDDFTALDFYWIGSRIFGHRVHLMDQNEALERIPEIDKIEEKVYEPVRRDDPRVFAKIQADYKSAYLVAEDEKSDAIGICFGAELKAFAQLPMIDSDIEQKNDDVFYAADLTLLPIAQGIGLGTRLKVEQIIEFARIGGRIIRSRNRMPEAVRMNLLNRRLGAVVLNVNPKDYGGSAIGYYQSRTISRENSKPFYFGSNRISQAKNKTSLGNFVSEGYIRNMLILKELKPKGLSHLYLASGRAESIDKAIKLLRFKRKDARQLLSFHGEVFGSTTAGVRSLGNPDEFFQWPTLEDHGTVDGFVSQLKEFDPDKTLGFMLKPKCKFMNKSRELKYLQELSVCLEKSSIPLILDESDSWLGQFSNDLFWVANEIRANLVTFAAYGQLGGVYADDEYYLKDPLMMISTWDGDEHSLNLTRDQILEFLSR